MTVPPSPSKVIAAADAYDGYGGREVYLAWCMVYAVTARLLTKVGEATLAGLAADRATHAAMAADSVTAQGWRRPRSSARCCEDQQLDQAERTAVSSAERLTTPPPQIADTPDSLGALWLIASVIAARKADRLDSDQPVEHGRTTHRP